MTHGAGLRVLAPQRPRVEAGAVGVKPPAAYHRMAGETIAFRVAGDAALQVLARGLAVIQQEELLGIVIPCIQWSLRGQSGVDMTVGAELTGVVAVAAAGLPGVGCRRVTGQKAGRVVSRCRVGRVGAVAVETLGTHVASFAGLGPGIGNRTVNLGEIPPM